VKICSDTKINIEFTNAIFGHIFGTYVAKFKKLCYFCTPNSDNESQLDMLAR